MPSSASAVSWAVILNNVAALDILMDCGFARAAVLVTVGAAAREVVGRTALELVGLDGWKSGIAEVMEVVEQVKAVVMK
jgi:lipid intermediate transporter